MDKKAKRLDLYNSIKGEIFSCSLNHNVNTCFSLITGTVIDFEEQRFGQLNSHIIGLAVATLMDFIRECQKRLKNKKYDKSKFLHLDKKWLNSQLVIQWPVSTIDKNVRTRQASQIPKKSRKHLSFY